MARELFKLVGLIGTKGAERTMDELKSINKQAKATARAFGRMGRDMQRTGANLTRGLTVPILGLGVAMYKGVQLASDLEETVTKVGEIFGESAGKIDAWANSSAEALGQSKRQAMDAAGTFAIFGKSAGLAGDKLVDFSKDFVGLSADLASFYNSSPEEAITAIGAAMRGEAEPIRRFGVMLNDATLRQKALEMGIIDSVKNALTPQQKVLAASAVVMEQTKVAHGDFARTSDGLANSQRILRAQVENVGVELGKIFLPIASKVVALLSEKVVPAVRKLAEWFSNLSPGMKATVIQLTALAAAIGPVFLLVGKLTTVGGLLIPVFAKLITGQISLNAAMSANPIGFIITLVAALTAAFIYLYNNWDTVKAALVKGWDAVAYAAKQTVSFVIELLAKYVKAHLDAIDTVGKFIPGVNKAIDAARGKLQELIDSQKDIRRERKLARIAAKQEALATEELTEVIETAKTATDGARASTVRLTDARKNAVTATEEQAKAEAKLAMDRVSFEEDAADTLLQATADKRTLLEAERQEALSAARSLGADVQDVEAYYALERERLREYEAEAKDEQRREEARKEEEKHAQIAQFGMDAVNGLFGVMAQANENKLAMIDEEAEREIAAVEASSLSQEEKDARIAQIEQDAQKRRKEIHIKQAKQEKAAAIFGAIVSTARAIAKVYELGIPGIVLAVVMGALGAAQVAMIAAQPLPKMAKGGLVRSGTGGITAEVGEGSQDELVLPMRTGVAEFIGQMFDRLGGMVAPSPMMPAMAGAGGRDVHLHIGTLIADDRGLKDLERRLESVRIMEGQRRGGDE